MSYNIIPTHRFEKEIRRLIKKFPSLKEEYIGLIDSIEQHPKSGDFIGNSCYKVRLSVSSKGKGKSGGARVITYVYVSTKTVYLLTIYDKSEKQDLAPNELKAMIASLQLDV